MALVENSYDMQHATRLIEDQSALSPDSVSKLLNPYLSSAEASNRRFSSINKNHMGYSPAQIRLEPVQVAAANPSAFNHQMLQTEQSPDERQQPIEEEVESPVRSSISPYQRNQSSLSQSPSPYERVVAGNGAIAA